MLCCLALLAIAGHGQTLPAAKPVSPAVKKNSPGHSASSDVELEKTISARFARSKISTDNFQVRVQGGAATITGRTDVLQHKGTATRLAKTSGAVKVINQVEVSDAAKQKASANLASGGRRVQVIRSDVPGRK
jgi:osmotically-inducible protein OsmY